MSGINKATIIGNLGKDPEIRYTQAGAAVASFSVAVSEKWKDKNTGQQQEKTEWINITVFGKMAEHVGKYLHKGSKVYVEGKITTQKWQDNEGKDRYSTSVVVQGFGGTIQFLDPNPNAGKNNQQNQPGQAQQQTNTPTDIMGQDEIDDSIPF